MKKILFLVLTLTTLVSFASAQNTLIYKEQGGAKEVVLSGGEIEVRTGGLIDMQAGSTLTIANAAVIGVISTPTFSNLTVTYGVAAATAALSSTLDVNGNFTSGADNYVTTNTASSGAWAFPATVNIGGALSGASGAFSTTMDVNGQATFGADNTVSTMPAAGSPSFHGTVTASVAVTAPLVNAGATGALRSGVRTISQLMAQTAVLGEIGICSDCSPVELFISTAAGAPNTGGYGNAAGAQLD